MRRPEYELLLKGGEIVSPARPGRARRDIAFAGGRVAAVEESISTERAEDVIRRRVRVGVGVAAGHPRRAQSGLVGARDVG